MCNTGFEEFETALRIRIAAAASKQQLSRNEGQNIAENSPKRVPRRTHLGSFDPARGDHNICPAGAQAAYRSRNVVRRNREISIEEARDRRLDLGKTTRQRLTFADSRRISNYGDLSKGHLRFDFSNLLRKLIASIISNQNFHLSTKTLAESRGNLAKSRFNDLRFVKCRNKQGKFHAANTSQAGPDWQYPQIRWRSG